MLSIPVVVQIDFEDTFNEMSDLLIAFVQIFSDACVGSAAYSVFLKVPVVHYYNYNKS